MRKTAASQGEKRFRLVIDQLPDPAKARPGVAQTRVRFALPVFVDRDKTAPASFTWRLTDGNLELANTGGAAARIVQIEVKKNGRVVPVEQNSLRYVHGASTIAWPIGKGCSLGKVQVTAQIDGRTVDAEPVPACG
jgi:fimbrial chaperone protein